MSKYLIFIIFVLVCLSVVSLRAQNPELTLQTGHSSQITAFSFSSDGKYLASAGNDNIIILWDFKLGKQLKILKGHHKSVQSIQFFRQNYQLISAGDDGQLIWWDLYSGQPKQIISLNCEIKSIDIDKQDHLLIANGISKDIYIYKIQDSLVFYKCIEAWNNEDSLQYIQKALKKANMSNTNWTSKKVEELRKDALKPVRLACPSSIFIDSDNKIMISRALLLPNNTFLLCDMKAVSLISNETKPYRYTARTIKPSKSGGAIAWSGKKSIIVLFDPKSEKKRFQRPGKFRRFHFTQIDFNAIDSIIAAVNEDGMIYYWKSNGYYFPPLENPNNNYTSICFHPLQKNLIVAGDERGEITLIDIFSGKTIKRFGSGIDPLLQLASNDEGNTLAVCGKKNVITTFSLKNRITVSGLCGHKKQISGFHFSSDSTLISTAYDNKIYKWDLSQNHAIKLKGNSNPALWSNIFNIPIYSVFLNTITSYYLFKRFATANQETLEHCTISNDNHLFATGGKGYKKGILFNWFIPRIFPVHIYETETMKKKEKIGAHYLSIDALSFNFNNRKLATAGLDFKTGISDLQSTRKTFSVLSLFVPMLGIYEAIKAVYSRNAFETYKVKNYRYSIYNALKIWNIESNELLKTYEFPNPIKAISFSTQNDTLLIADEKYNITLLQYKSDSIRKITNGTAPLLFSENGKAVFYQDPQHRLHLFDLKKDSTVVLFKGHNDSITDITLLRNRNQIATSSLDGSVKIWDLKTGKEIVTLYTINNEDFIIKTPDYYYYATKNAKKEIGFTFGIKFYPFEQFDLQYNRPDIVLSRLGTASPDMINALKLAYKKRLQRSGFNEEMFSKDFHLPEIQIVNENNILPNQKQEYVTIDINAFDSKYLLDRILIWINDVPIFGYNGINIRDLKTNSVHKSFQLHLTEGLNVIKISCMNEKGVESLKETIEVIYTPEKHTKPSLYIVTIGASEYSNTEWNLKYAAKDANDIVTIFDNQKQYYNSVNVITLLNKEVTIKNIDKLKNTLKQSHVNDKVLIFYAGHGLLDENYNYYLGTYDINFNHPSEKGLPYEMLNTLLDSIPAREKLLLIDACHSGEVDQDEVQSITAQVAESKEITFRGAKPRGFNSNHTLSYNNSFELMKELFSDLRNGTGAIVISSAGGGEFAYEGEQWKNGVFTYSLRQALLSGLADKNHDQQITVSELQNFVIQNVLKLTDGKQKPTMRQENIENDFVIWKK
jgi:WD40 repeat protein